MHAESSDDIYTNKVPVGNRTYYFDVKMSKSGSKYLRISELILGKSNPQRIMIFEEAILEFLHAINEEPIDHSIKLFPAQIVSAIPQSLGRIPSATYLWKLEYSHVAGSVTNPCFTGL